MARIPRGKHKHVNLTNLWEHHKEIARRLLLGERQVDICKAINVSPSWLSIITTSPAFIKYLDSLRARTEIGITDIRKEINAGAIEAVGVLRSLLKSGDEKVQLATAKDFLDRDGYVPVKKIEQTTVEVHLNSERIEALKAKRAALLQNQQRVLQVN